MTTIALPGFEDENDEPDELVPPVHAVKSTTGLGKTSLFVDEVAADRLHPRPDGAKEMYSLPWGYLVPTHRLGEKVADLFREQGLTACVIRSREALNAKKQPMCRNLVQVKLAMDFHASIQETCCKRKDAKGKEWRCPLFEGCRFQEQFPDDVPDVFIAAHQMMFHEQERFGEFAAIGIDESFWEAGLWGIDADEEKWTINVDEIGNREIPADQNDHDKVDQQHRLGRLRKRLAQALQKQTEVGGLEASVLGPVYTDNVVHISVDDIDIADCSEAHRLEWALMPKVEIVPGMSPAAIKAFYIAHKQEMFDRSFARQMIALWEAVRDFLNMKDVEVSGRILIKEHDRKRYVVVRGVYPIRKQWQVPAMIMDATLPALPMLQAYFPQVEVGEPVEVDMPSHVMVRQILKAPVSAKRLIKTESDVNRQKLRRYILRRWTETGRQRTLVICQKEYERWLKPDEEERKRQLKALGQEKYESWLKARSLPDNICVEHYNNIAGLDDYKDVRLLILIGRVIPGPDVAETYAAVLTGAQPKKLPRGKWYKKVRRGIRLADGSGIAVDCDEHPDPIVEMVRLQLCEAEIIQAIGRARGINRGNDDPLCIDIPLDIDIVADVCLDLTVNEVSNWWEQRPSLMVEAAAEGVVLTSPVDLVKAWPHVWGSTIAADRTLGELKKEPSLSALRRLLTGWQPVTYQLAGARMKRRVGYFDLTMIPHPEVWLEIKLGPLTSVSNNGPDFG